MPIFADKLFTDSNIAFVVLLPMKSYAIRMDMKANLLQKFKSREAHIGIVGVGYVGLPLVVAFAQAGFMVAAVDTDKSKIEAIKRGESYIEDCR